MQSQNLPCFQNLTTASQTNNLHWKGLMVVVWSNGLLKANKSQLLPDGDFTASLAHLLKHFTTLIVVFVDFFVHHPTGTFYVQPVSVVSCPVPVVLQRKSTQPLTPSHTPVVVNSTPWSIVLCWLLSQPLHTCPVLQLPDHSSPPQVLLQYFTVSAPSALRLFHQLWAEVNGHFCQPAVML